MALSINPRYIISLPYGLLRLAIIIVAIIIMICMGTIDLSAGVNGLMWFTISGSAITAAVFLIFYMINFPPTFPRLPWSLVEFGIMCFWVLLYIMSFIACCVMASKYSWWGSVHAGYGAAAFFCLINLIAVGALAGLLFKLFRVGGSTFQMSSTTTTTTSSVKY